jgi:hypothetical protein
MNPSEHIDQLIATLTDWRGQTFAAIRKHILEADGEIVEEWKYMGSPVWYRDGMIAVANAHKGKVKLTFAHGASLPDPDKLFNAGLQATRGGPSIFSRAIRSMGARCKTSSVQRSNSINSSRRKRRLRSPRKRSER